MGNLINVQVMDGASPFVQSVAKQFPQYIERGLKSVGFMAQKEIKAGIRSGSPGGQSYVAHSLPDRKRRDLERVFGGSVKSKYNFMGKLNQAVGYDKKTTKQGYISVGWLSPSAVAIGTRQELGANKNVTPRVKRAYNMAKLSLSKSTITLPQRPTFGPMKRVLQPKVKSYFEDKLVKYINNANFRGSQARNNRDYTVY